MKQNMQEIIKCEICGEEHKRIELYVDNGKEICRKCSNKIIRDAWSK
jgi:formylmethanofuran dehydrogenase subunit E